MPGKIESKIYFEVTTTTIPTKIDQIGCDGLYIKGIERVASIPHTEQQWSFPVGNDQYPPEIWYAAVVHDLTGAKNNGYKHTGIDLNLDDPPYGDIERHKGLAVYAIADGQVTFVDESWSGVPMIVIRHEHEGKPLWVRYAHIVPTVILSQYVKAGQTLGGFADWGHSPTKGDHLHFDMATEPFTTEWLNKQRVINWVNPVDILKQHLDPARVDAMLKKR